MAAHTCTGDMAFIRDVPRRIARERVPTGRNASANQIGNPRLLRRDAVYTPA